MKKIVYILLGLILLLLLLSVISCAKPENSCAKTENSVQNFPDAPEVIQITGSRQIIVGGLSKGHICEVQVNNHDFFYIYSDLVNGSIDLTHNPDCKKCNK